jgi:hypothetical protein
MADGDPWKTLTRFSIIVLIGIIVLWILYALTGGPSIPRPQGQRDTIPATKQ